MAWEGPGAVVLDGFTWDERKNLSNLDKHGVDFEEAATCFADSRDKQFTASRLKGELRWILQGTSDYGRSLNVIFLLEKVDDGAVARIISTRRRTR